MKKRPLKIVVFTLILILMIKGFSISLLKEVENEYKGMSEHSEDVSIHFIHRNHKDWKSLYDIINTADGLQDYNHFDLTNSRIGEHSLVDVISEVSELRRALRYRIDRNKEMLANYNVYNGNEAVVITPADNEEITELRESISTSADIFDDDMVEKKKKTFLEPYEPCRITNLIEGNCIGLRGPPTFKETIHLV